MNEAEAGDNPKLSARYSRSADNFRLPVLDNIHRDFVGTLGNTLFSEISHKPANIGHGVLDRHADTPSDKWRPSALNKICAVLSDSMMSGWRYIY